MKYFVFALLTCLPLLQGCQINSIEGEVDGVNIKADRTNGDGPHDGDFCPPGQAKKGNC